MAICAESFVCAFPVSVVASVIRLRQSVISITACDMVARRPVDSLSATRKYQGCTISFPSAGPRTDAPDPVAVAALAVSTCDAMDTRTS